VESGRYRLLLELIGRNSEPLAGGALDLGTVRVEAPARVFTLPVAAPAISAQFGELANLAAYELDPVQLEPGQELSLHVYWRAVGLTETRYTVFVHLVGPEGEIVAQHDQQPAGGNRPTTSWLPGEIVADEYHLAVPAAAVSDSYRLRLGLYDPASGERMPVVQAGVPAGDHYFLPEVVEIVPSD
jgi:hypothetical protein